MNRETTRRLGWVALFLALAFSVDRLGGVILGRVLMSSEFRYSRLYRGDLPEDSIWILGNSRGLYSFYAPAIEQATGIPTINLSFHGTSMIIASQLFHDGLRHNPDPGYVLIEATALDVGHYQLENFKPYFTRSHGLSRLADRIGEPYGWGCRLSRLYCYNGEMFLRTLYYLDRTDQRWANRYVISEEVIEEARTAEPMELRILPENLAALERLRETAEEREIEVRLVMGPYLPIYAETITNLDDWMADLERRSGLRVWDFSRAVEDIHGFSDRVHMTPEGSEILVGKMIEAGVLPGRASGGDGS